MWFNRTTLDIPLPSTKICLSVSQSPVRSRCYQRSVQGQPTSLDFNCILERYRISGESSYCWIEDVGENTFTCLVMVIYCRCIKATIFLELYNDHFINITFIFNNSKQLKISINCANTIIHSWHIIVQIKTIFIRYYKNKTLFGKAYINTYTAQQTTNNPPYWTAISNYWNCTLVNILISVIYI